MSIETQIRLADQRERCPRVNTNILSAENELQPVAVRTWHSHDTDAGSGRIVRCEIAPRNDYGAGIALALTRAEAEAMAEELVKASFLAGFYVPRNIS